MILVTGGTGLVGGALIARLMRDVVDVRVAAMRPGAAFTNGTDVALVGDLSGQTDWLAALIGVECSDTHGGSGACDARCSYRPLVRIPPSQCARHLAFRPPSRSSRC